MKLTNLTAREIFIGAFAKHDVRNALGLRQGIRLAPAGDPSGRDVKDGLPDFIYSRDGVLASLALAGDILVEFSGGATSGVTQPELDAVEAAIPSIPVDPPYLIWRAGGPTSGAIFADWTDLYAVYSALVAQGVVPEIHVDDQGVPGSLVIPPGVYQFPVGAAFVGIIGPAAPTVVLMEGAVFQPDRLLCFSAVRLDVQATSTPVIILGNANDNLLVKFTMGAVCQVSGTAPFLVSAAQGSSGGICVLAANDGSQIGPGPVFEDATGALDDGFVMVVGSGGSGGDIYADSFALTASSTLMFRITSSEVRVLNIPSLPPSQVVWLNLVQSWVALDPMLMGPAVLAISEARIYPCDRTAGTVEYLLPPANSLPPGVKITLKAVDATVNALIVTPDGTDSIDLLAAPTVNITPNAVINLVTDGSSMWLSV